MAAQQHRSVKQSAQKLWHILAHPVRKGTPDNSVAEDQTLLLFAIHKRVQELKREIAELRAASEKYHRRPRHSTLEINEHLRQELRLQEILGELASFTKRMEG